MYVRAVSRNSFSYFRNIVEMFSSLFFKTYFQHLAPFFRIFITREKGDENFIRIKNRFSAIFYYYYLMNNKWLSIIISKNNNDVKMADFNQFDPIFSTLNGKCIYFI